MDIRLIKLFNVALVENKKMSMDMFKQVNQLAAQVGYFAHPDVCNESVLNFLKEIEINNEKFKTILRLATSKDDPKYKNSIITFMKIDEKEWNRIINNKKVLYKSE